MIMTKPIFGNDLTNHKLRLSPVFFDLLRFSFVRFCFFNMNMKYYTTPSFIFLPNLLAVLMLSSFSNCTLNCPTIALLSAIFL